MHGDELGSVRERSLDLDRMDHLGDAFHDVVASEDRGSERHKIGHRASVRIPSRTSAVMGDGFGMVEFEAAFPTTTGPRRRQLLWAFLLPRAENHWTPLIRRQKRKYGGRAAQAGMQRSD